MIIRYAVITDEVSQDLSTALDVCIREGIEGVEIRSVWGKAPLDLTLDDAKKIRSMCERAGRQIVGFDSPVGKVAMPTTCEALRIEQDRLRRSSDLAQALGANWIRVFTFLRDNDFDHADVAAIIHDLYNEHRGPELMVETGTETTTPTAALTASLLAQAALDVAPKVLWDPGNTMFAGFDENPAHAVAALGEQLGHVHVKDPQGTRRYVTVGAGDLDWSNVIDALDKAGYAGWLSLETHVRSGRELTALERRCPWGEAFSAGGEQATSACLAGLRRAAAANQSVTGIDHVQLAMPAGSEATGEHFYGRLLGLERVPKPLDLAARGGCWFQAPGFQIHLGVEDGFSPARKAHPALLVNDIDALIDRLATHGFEVATDRSLLGYVRGFVHDPFGNRVELMQATSDNTKKVN